MLLGNKFHTPSGVQYAGYPGKTLNLTQGVDGAYSHEGSMAIDDAGEDVGVDRRYAPADMRCSWKDAPGGVNGINYQTLAPVLCRDGILRNFTFRMVHDNYIDDIKVGDIKRQGEIIGHEGVAGKATGNHSHFVVGDGWIAGQGLVKNKYDIYEMKNELRPWDVFFVDNTIIKQGLGYRWATFAQYVAEIKAQMKVLNLETQIIEKAISEVLISPTGLKVTVEKSAVVK